MIHDWWISICCVCFLFQGWLLCDCPVSGNNQLAIKVCFVDFYDLSYSCHFLWQRLHSPSGFSSLFLSSLESSSAKLGKHVTLWFALTPPSLKWSTEQKNPKSLQSLQYEQHDTTNFAVRIWWKKIKSEIEDANRLWTLLWSSNAVPIGVSFKIKWCFCLRLS